jgi:signal transduction histidine kinase
MTNVFLLDWAIMAVSLFNTILLLWLGLTVLLNADRRTWGIWLAGGGLLMAGAFFVSHTAILGHGLSYVSQGMNFWWRAGWLPVVTLPAAWYVLTLWYAGFWDHKHSSLRRRHRPWFLFIMLLAIGLVGLLLFANPLPSYTQVAQLNLSATPAAGGIPILVLFYPLYIVFCISLSLDVLRRPGPPGRIMGDLARRRARPWLMATSIALLAVSLLVAWVMLWVIQNARLRADHSIYTDMSITVAWFDLTIASLIALAIIFLGRAIISYEIFTGKTLPRRGFFRHWRSAVILAAGYGVVVGWSLRFQLRQIYSLLLTTMLMTLFYALFSWRSYVERERYIEHLRPFVVSQHLYDHLLTATTAPPDVDAIAPFQALCEDVLGARLAYLVALGPLAPLVGPPLIYPNDVSPTLPSFTQLAARFDSPQTMRLTLNPTRYADANWAVPLWSERGLIGVLLLGDKRDGGLYTQEEIEIARASGERLIDTQASAAMARRLMALQRQRLAKTQVIDQQTRRALHDDILPRLHTTILSLSAHPDDSSAEAVKLLTDTHRQIANLLRDMPITTAPEVARLGLVGALRHTVDNELAQAFDAVNWEIEPQADGELQTLPTLTTEVLYYAAREAIRNAACYGRGDDASRPLHLRVTVTWPDQLEIHIEDDGVGLKAEARTNEGNGQGLALHSTMMAVVGGALTIESVPDTYTRVLLAVPQGA